MRKFLLKLVSLFNLKKEEDDDVHLNVSKQKSSRDVNFYGYKVKKAYPMALVRNVDDFVEPRYVYHTFKESVVHDSSLGDVIGYRISNTLVIHQVVGVGCIWAKESVIDFEDVFGGECVDITEDVPLILKYWNDISRMRIAMGDKPLPAKCFWASNGWGFEAVADESDSNNKKIYYANIILKRKVN